jgi:hypothetical protein
LTLDGERDVACRKEWYKGAGSRNPSKFGAGEGVTIYVKLGWPW